MMIHIESLSTYAWEDLSCDQMDAIVKTDNNVRLNLECLNLVQGKSLSFYLPDYELNAKIHEVGAIDPIRYSMAI